MTGHTELLNAVKYNPTFENWSTNTLNTIGVNAIRGAIDGAVTSAEGYVKGQVKEGSKHLDPKFGPSYH